LGVFFLFHCHLHPAEPSAALGLVHLPTLWKTLSPKQFYQIIMVHFCLVRLILRFAFKLSSLCLCGRALSICCEIMFCRDIVVHILNLHCVEASDCLRQAVAHILILFSNSSCADQNPRKCH
jgi:hypothetical protein